MNYLKSILIITYVPHYGSPILKVAIEFHRRKGFREFDDITSRDLKRLCKALKDNVHTNTTRVYVENDCIISDVSIY
jgi:hypothetical protein